MCRLYPYFSNPLPTGSTAVFLLHQKLSLWSPMAINPKKQASRKYASKIPKSKRSSSLAPQKIAQAFKRTFRSPYAEPRTPSVKMRECRRQGCMVHCAKGYLVYIY